MGKTNATRRLSAQFGYRCMKSTLLGIWKVCALLCFLVAGASSATDGLGVSDENRAYQCRDTDPRYHCTAVGEASGKMVIQGSLERCSTKDISESRKNSLKFVQFELSKTSTIEFSAEGLVSMTIHDTNFLDQSPLADGVFFQMSLSPGTYTLTGEVPQCVDSLYDRETYRIGIENVSDNAIAGPATDRADEVDGEEFVLPDPVVAVANTVGVATLVTLGTLAAAFLVIFLLYASAY